MRAPLQAKAAAAKDGSTAPVINVGDYGYSKVLGKGQLPPHALVVKAKFISKLAERKLKEAGGAAILVA